MRYINCTPHTIVLNDGRKFINSGSIARVNTTFTDIVDDVCKQTFGEVSGLPEPSEGVSIIVSAMVLSASSRTDLVAPATGHPKTVRNGEGHIISVPGFVAR